MARGRFITFEGGEGSGKSTQIARLAARLRSRGVVVIETREPGGTPGGDAIRRLLVEGEVGRWDPTSEALLHFAARRQHLVETIWPALDRGDWVLSDRFADSTMAYQGYGHRLGRDIIETLYRVTVGTFEPDLTLIFDLPVELGLQRAGLRGGAEDRYERMGVEFHERVRDGLLEIARRAPARCRIIDASGAPDAVEAAVAAAVGQAFGLELSTNDRAAKPFDA
ncbi:MAG TPA: dTMP kinase [Alphaproteobacteria bacterium]